MEKGVEGYDELKSSIQAFYTTQGWLHKSAVVQEPGEQVQEQGDVTMADEGEEEGIVFPTAGKVVLNRANDGSAASMNTAFLMKLSPDANGVLNGLELPAYRPYECELCDRWKDEYEVSELKKEMNRCDDCEAEDKRCRQCLLQLRARRWHLGFETHSRDDFEWSFLNSITSRSTITLAGFLDDLVDFDNIMPKQKVVPELFVVAETTTIVGLFKKYVGHLRGSNDDMACAEALDLVNTYVRAATVLADRL